MNQMIYTMFCVTVLSAPYGLAADVDDVHQMLDGIEQAWAQHNLETLAGYCHPSLLTIISRPGIPDGAIVLKRDQVQAQIGKGWSSVVSHQFVEREINVRNGVAWMQLAVADRMTDRSTRLTHVLNLAVRVGPAWKMCFSMPRLLQTAQVVEDLPSDSPAGGAGLRPGDLVVSVAGRPAAGVAASRPAASPPSGPQDVVVRRKSEELHLQVRAWPGGAQLSERLIPFGSASLVSTDAPHPAKDRSLDVFRGCITGDVDRAMQAICPAGYLALRMPGGQGAAVPVDAAGSRVLLEEDLRQTRKSYDMATMQITRLSAIGTDDVVVVGGVITATTRGNDARSVSSPTAIEVWVRQGKDWFLTANLPLAVQAGLDTTARGPSVDAKAVEQRIAGKMVGIGVALEKVDAGLRIKEVMQGAPAERGGLHSGDIITAIEGRPTKGLAVNEAVSRITGTEGTDVTLAVQGPDGDPRTVKLTREAFKPSPVSGQLLKDGVALVSIPLFYQDAPQDFAKQVEALRAQGATRLVLDLRNCTGGTSDSTRATAEMLVPAGKTLWVVQSGSSRNPVVSRRARSIDLPVVVLVGTKTGGAGELLASALKENNRATLLGQTTSGLARLRQASQRPGGQGEIVDIGTILSAANVPITDRGVQPNVQVPGNVAEAEVMRRAMELLKSKAQP